MQVAEENDAGKGCLLNACAATSSQSNTVDIPVTVRSSGRLRSPQGVALPLTPYPPYPGQGSDPQISAEKSQGGFRAVGCVARATGDAASSNQDVDALSQDRQEDVVNGRGRGARGIYRGDGRGLESLSPPCGARLTARRYSELPEHSPRYVILSHPLVCKMQVAATFSELIQCL